MERKSLTPKEEAIVQLVAAGLSNKQIAAELGAGLDTVKKHVSSILRKLQLPNRAAIAAWAAKRGGDYPHQSGAGDGAAC